MNTPILDHNYNCKITTSENESFLIDSLRLYNENMHHWYGWVCNVGVDSLRIDGNLNIFNGVCKQKLLGNLAQLHSSNESFHLPHNPAVCDKLSCTGCSTDLQMHKFNPKHYNGT